MADPAVIVEKEGHVLVVTLNRPEKKNAVNCEVMCRLYDAWVRLDGDDELRVGILTGRGDTFCAGMDLSEIGKLRSGVCAGDRLLHDPDRESAGGVLRRRQRRHGSDGPRVGGPPIGERRKDVRPGDHGGGRILRFAEVTKNEVPK